MTSPSPRFNIRGFIVVVAAYALAFAALPAGPAVFVAALLTAFAALVVGPARWTGMTRSRVAVWVAAAHPWSILAALYLTWAVARVDLGHPPRAVRDAPKELGLAVLIVHALTWFLLLGTPVVVMTSLILACAEARNAAQRGGRGAGGVVAG